MTEVFDPNSLELFDTPIRNLGDALHTGLFNRGVMDMFYKGVQYRIENLTFTLVGDSLSFDPKTKLKRFVNGVWISAQKTVMGTHFYGQAAIVMIHDSVLTPDGKKKLKFITLSQKDAEGDVFQFVLYRSGYRPMKEDLQIIGWQNQVSPVLGGVAVAGQKH